MAKKKTTQEEALQQAKELDIQLRDLQDLHDHALGLRMYKDATALQSQINSTDRKLVRIANTHHLWGQI